MLNKTLILMYHRVASLDSDPWGLSVSPQHFEEQLEVLKKIGRLYNVGTFVSDLRERKLEGSSIAITFDDGYADNFHSAMPLLEKHDIPATIFIVTGAVGSVREFWWDELDRLLLQPGPLPEQFHWGSRNEVKWNLADVTDYSEAQMLQNRSWRTQHPPPTERHALYYFLWGQLRPMSTAERQLALEEFRRWAGKDVVGRLTHRPMSLEELKIIGDAQSLELGCHTVTHPRLSTLPPEAQLQEISDSKKMLEEMIENDVGSFAYPYGGSDDFSNSSSMAVRESGLSSACTTRPGTVSASVDVYQLPRMPVEDWNGEEFDKILQEWFAEG